MGKYTTLEEQVLYGLDSIDENRLVEMKLKDAVFLHQLIHALIHFFEQPRHYPDIEDIHQFLGDADMGALKMMITAYREILQDVLPADIHQEFAEGDTFDNPEPPYYTIEY